MVSLAVSVSRTERPGEGLLRRPGKQCTARPHHSERCHVNRAVSPARPERGGAKAPLTEAVAGRDNCGTCRHDFIRATRREIVAAGSSSLPFPISVTRHEQPGCLRFPEGYTAPVSSSAAGCVSHPIAGAHAAGQAAKGASSARSRDQSDGAWDSFRMVFSEPPYPAPGFMTYSAAISVVFTISACRPWATFQRAVLFSLARATAGIL